MSRRRSAIAAFQVALVVVLTIVVALTLLRGEDAEVPPGLEAPGRDVTGIGGKDPSSSYVPQSSRRNAGDPGRDRGARRDALGPASIAAPAPVPPSTGGAPGGQDDDEGSPTEDQYADTLARLGSDLY